MSNWKAIYVLHHNFEMTILSNLLLLCSRSDRVKGLDLIECLKNYGRRFITLYRRQ